MKEISIVIPVFNSEENLTELHRQIREAMKKFTYEIIFVNDGSRDRSWAIISELQAVNRNVIGINLRKNSGQDNAIMAGLNNISGRYAVIMDDDLQHSPSDIEKLYLKCKEGYDVCYARFSKKKQAIWKNLGSWLNGKAAEILLNKPKDVYLSPFQIVRREVVDEIIRYRGPYPYVQGLLLNVTENLAQVDAEHYNRYRGRGHFSLIKSIRVFLRLATTFSIFPLRFSTIIGTMVATAGFLLIPFYLYQYFFMQRVIEGWTTLIVTLLVLGGMILMSLGLIGEYLGRMYLNINNKPQYTIERILRKKS